MRLDKLTEKSREAVLEAQHLAESYNHPAVEPEHLLLLGAVLEPVADLGDGGGLRHRWSKFRHVFRASTA